MQFKSVALALVVTPATQAAAQSVTAPEDLVGTAVAAWTVEALLKDKEKLTAIVVHHVVSRRVDGLHG